MSYYIVLVSSVELTIWPQVVKKALAELGEIDIVSEEAVIETLAILHSVAMVILDASVIQRTATLVSDIQRLYPELPVVVATISPTWTRTKATSRSGAFSITRTSNVYELQSQILEIIEGSPQQLKKVSQT